MPLSRIGSGAVAATSATITAAEGDLVLVWAYRSNNATAPTAAADYNTGTGNSFVASNSGGGTNGSVRFAWRVAPSGGLSNTGVFANATHLAWMVMRGAKVGSEIGNVSTNGGNNAATSQVYPALNLSGGESGQWVVAMGGRTTGHANMATAPTDMTNHASVPATPIVGLHSTNGARESNWPSTSVAGMTSVKHVGVTVEVLSQPPLEAGTASLVDKSHEHVQVSATESTGGLSGATRTYQWERRLAGGAWGDLSGATALTLNDTAVATSTDYEYRQRQMAGAETVWTNVVTVTTDAPPVTGPTAGFTWSRSIDAAVSGPTAGFTWTRSIDDASPANQPPATPAIVSVTVHADGTVTATSSAFSDPDGDSHAASRWRVWRVE